MGDAMEFDHTHRGSIMISRHRLVTAIVGASLFIAACGGDDDTSSGDTTPAAVETSPASAPDGAPDETTAEPATGEPATGEPIVIGMPLAQTGPAGVADHKDFQNGAELAVEEINASGGVAGRPLELQVVDIDLLSPEGTTAAFQSLTDSNVSAIASPFVLIPPPAMDVAAAYGAPYINGNTSIDSINMVVADPEKYSNVFHADAPETFYGSGLIPYLDELQTQGWEPKNNKIHIVQGEIAYTQIISQATQDAIEESGGAWELAGVTDIQAGIQDWGPVIQEIQEADAGFLMISHWVAAELAAFSQQYVANPVEGQLVYLQYGPSQPEFLDLAGDAAEGMIWGTVYGVYADEQGVAFRDAYQAKFPGTMGLVYTGGAYDMVHILAKAWETADPTDFEAVNAAIRAIPYRGVNGFYTFDREGQAGQVYPEQVDDIEAGQAHLIFQVQDGKHTIVLPAELAEAEFVPTPWMK
jgi:branched-chain amino acid transport system substrate-binding protein